VGLLVEPGSQARPGASQVAEKRTKVPRYPVKCEVAWSEEGSVRRDVAKGLGTAHYVSLDQPLRAMTWEQVVRIDEALAEIGPYGEVWLVKEGDKTLLLRKSDVEYAAGAP